MLCSGGKVSKGSGGIAEIKVITETGGTNMNGFRGWHGSESKEISPIWGGYQGFRFSRGLGGCQQIGTLGEGDPPDFFPHKHHCGIFHLEQLTDAIASEGDTSSVYLQYHIDCETQTDEDD